MELVSMGAPTPSPGQTEMDHHKPCLLDRFLTRPLHELRVKQVLWKASKGNTNKHVGKTSVVWEPVFQLHYSKASQVLDIKRSIPCLCTRTRKEAQMSKKSGTV